MLAYWSLLIKGAASAVGALLFLRIVVNDLAGSEEWLWRLEEKKRKSRQRDKEALAKGEALIVAEKVSGK